jgi:prefoldin subunit 5
MPRERPSGEGRQEKRRMIEELTEGVVEEKWQDFRRRIDDMSSMFQQLNQRISIIEQKLGQAQGEKKSDLLEIEGKIDTYKQSIDQIQSRMESVEMAMKDSLTPMMQTLRSLSETIKALKEKKS